jgi:hypothetical protein
MVKFDNKLEVRYYFNDKSRYIDAMVNYKCDKEVVSVLRALADMLDVKMTVYKDASQPVEGYRDIYSVAGECARSISVVINIFMHIWTSPIFTVGGQFVTERSADDDELMLRKAAELRRGLKLKQPGLVIPDGFIALLASSPRFCKCKSNFYEALRGCPKISRYTLRELNGSDRSRSGSLEVKREKFDYYLLRSDELPSITDNKATIEIISPVLKDAKFKWKGIYNKGGKTIDFYMNDEEFKQEMFDEKVSFKSKMCIDCVLKIDRKLSELGEEIPVCYTVETVVRTRFDKMEILTPQGKRHLRKLEGERKQLTLDLFG